MPLATFGQKLMQSVGHAKLEHVCTYTCCPSNVALNMRYSTLMHVLVRTETATSLMHAVTNLQHIEQIDHTFLESGHTQMECDSMHAAIEFAKKTEIYVPHMWKNVIRMTRKKIHIW